MMEWHEGEFDILFIDPTSGTQWKEKVHGWIYGLFGVHQSGKYGFSISHIPTGRRISIKDSLESAKGTAEALARIDIDWKRKQVDYYRNLSSEMLDQINEIREIERPVITCNTLEE